MLVVIFMKIDKHAFPVLAAILPFSVVGRRLSRPETPLNCIRARRVVNHPMSMLGLCAKIPEILAWLFPVLRQCLVYLWTDTSVEHAVVEDCICR